ncbi:MAG: hypothetical protein IJH57_04820 [Mogibacterium sp.]|nr:hypothetical protein [Mogibacterium sp.]
MIYKERLENLISELNERRCDLLQELEVLPEGRLMILKNDGTERYLQRIPATGNRKKERRYGIKKNEDVLNGLIRKDYILKALKTIDKDIQRLEKAASLFAPSDENSVMKDFMEANPAIANKVYRSTIDESAWKSRFGRIEEYHPENMTQTAADGTNMRSKNEVYIASRLDHYGLIYRSDCPTGIPGLYRVPDFTVLRKRDNKVVYWEHLGMMDDLEYRIDNKRKFEEYEAVGIVPWDNLIVTYDSEKGGLRAELIEAMIKAWLL